jgi:hypothetical protein
VELERLKAYKPKVKKVKKSKVKKLQKSKVYVPKIRKLKKRKSRSVSTCPISVSCGVCSAPHHFQ